MKATPEALAAVIRKLALKRIAKKFGERIPVITGCINAGHTVYTAHLDRYTDEMITRTFVSADTGLVVVESAHWSTQRKAKAD